MEGKRAIYIAMEKKKKKKKKVIKTRAPRRNQVQMVWNNFTVFSLSSTHSLCVCNI